MHSHLTLMLIIAIHLVITHLCLFNMDIQDIYLPKGFNQFKIEGRSLGSAVVLEMLLYYLARPEYQLQVREEIYLSSSLDLF